MAGLSAPNGKFEVTRDGLKVGWNVAGMAVAVALGWYITATISPIQQSLESLNSILSKIEAQHEADVRVLNEKQVVCSQNMVQVQAQYQALAERVRRNESELDIRHRYGSAGQNGMSGMPGETNANPFSRQ